MRNILLLIAAVAGIAVLSRQKAKPELGKATEDHPLCAKYPGGSWSEYHGTVAGVPVSEPGWSDEDSEVVRTAVLNQMPSSIPAFGSMHDVREFAFKITRTVVNSLCPSKKVARKQTVERYKRQSPAFEHLWDSVQNIVWNKLSAELGAIT